MDFLTILMLMSEHITPVMLTDSTGYYSEFTSFITNRMYNHIYSYFKFKGLRHIASEKVYYNEEDGEIENSYLVQDLGTIIIYSYYLAKQSEYSGDFDSGGGIASEWIVHNIIYDVAYVPNKIFGWGSDVLNSAQHFGVGRSVFDELDNSLDSSRNDRLERYLVFSASYSVEYLLFRGDANNDLYEYLRRNGVE